MAESRLADIYRKELKTKGLLGALVSASGARLKEKTDIRGILPQTGVSGAAFEKMFGKRYKYGGDKQEVRSSGGSDSASTKSMEEKLTRIGVDGKLTAKNTVVLPAMARDMNLMRMNMQKMVKLSGGTPSTKSDMFFKRASDRETQYEEQFKRNSGGLTPTPVGGKKEEGGGGFLSTILNFFKGGIGSIVDTLLGALIKGGLIAGFLVALGKYFHDDDGFRQTVNNMLDGIFSTVFGDDYKKNLATGAAILAGAYVAFQASLALLEAAIFAAARRILMLGGGPGLPGGPGGPGAPGQKGGRGGWMRGLGTTVGIGVIGKGIEYYLKQGESEADARKLAQEDIDKQKLGLDPGEEIVPSPKKPEGMRGSEIANRVTSAAVGADLLRSGLSGLPSAPSAIPSSKVSDPFAHLEGKKLTPGGSVRAGREIEKNKPLLEKIAKVMTQAWKKGVSTEMLMKIGKKFGLGVMTKISGALLGVVAAPFSVGASLLITALGVYMLASDIVDLYKWFVEYEKELDAYEKSTSPTPVAADPTSVVTASTSVSPEGGDTTSTPMAAAASKVTPGGATSTSPSPAASASSTSPASGGPSSLTEVSAYGGYKNRQEFTDAMMPWAQKAANELKVPAEAILAQWGLETGYGKAGAVQGQFNYGNIQGTYRPSEPGLDSGRPRNFIKYNSMDDFVNDYVKQLKNPRYGLGKENLASQQFFEKLKTGGYAEDPNYVATLMKVTGGTLTAGTPGKTPTYTPSTPASAPSQQAGSPSTGNALTDLFAEYSTFRDNYMKQNGGGNTTVNAPVTNVSQSSGGGSNNTTPYNNDMMRYLLRPVT